MEHTPEELAKIEQLKKQLQKVNDGFLELMDHKSEIYERYAREIDIASEKRIESLQKWKEDEHAAANRLYDGMIYGIEGDIDKITKEAQKRVFNIIHIKYQVLNEKLPKPAEYFSEFNTPFLNECKAADENSVKKISIDLTDEPILSKEEIEASLDEFNQKDIASISSGKLTVGSSVYTVGSDISVILSNKVNVSGTINSIEPSEITFLQSGGEEIRLSALAINSGLVQITGN